MKSSVLAIIVIAIIVIAGVGGYAYYLSTLAPSKPAPPPSKTLKIALILPSEANDFGWNQDIATAFAQDSPIYGYNFTVDQNVGEATTADTAALEYYAGQGYQIVWAAADGWQVPVLTAAAAYPNTYFVCADLTNFTNPSTGALETNVLAIDYNLTYGAYAAGILAAYLSKTGIIGYQAGFSFPSTEQIGYAFMAGARSVNSSIKFVYDFPGTWADVAAGSVGAQSLISAGADVLLFRGDGQTLGGEQAVAAAGYYAIGDMLDQSPLNPDHIVASNTYNDTTALSFVLNHFINGQMSQIVDRDNNVPNTSSLTLGPAASTLLTTQQLQHLNEVIEGLNNGTIVPPFVSTLPPSGS